MLKLLVADLLSIYLSALICNQDSSLLIMMLNFILQALEQQEGWPYLRLSALERYHCTGHQGIQLLRIQATAVKPAQASTEGLLTRVP